MTAHRPWAIGPSIGGSKYVSIVDPAGDAELGDWMIAERVRRPEHAALIVRAVNAHEGLVAALERLLDVPDRWDWGEPAGNIREREDAREQARAALKAAAHG